MTESKLVLSCRLLSNYKGRDEELILARIQ